MQNRSDDPAPGASPEEIEALAEAVHRAYLDTCARLGWPVKPSNAVPYAALSEDSKELDRASVRAVLAALTAAPPLPEREEADESGTPFDRYERWMIAESDLEEVVIEAFGGLGNLPFHNWWFDYYDRSVELPTCPSGFAPTLAQLEALLAAGIFKVYVSYSDETARLWYWRDGWKDCECQPKDCEGERRGLVATQAARIAELKLQAETIRREERERIAGELRQRVEDLLDSACGEDGPYPKDQIWAEYIHEFADRLAPRASTGEREGESNE